MHKVILIILCLAILSPAEAQQPERTGPVRVLVVTGGHSYNKEMFMQMMESLGDNITFDIEELPRAYDYFLVQNRDKYDVLLFYHMFQEIDNEQKRNMTECIRMGKPVIALHHSICAFDNWPEYFRIIGGKYFHNETTVGTKSFEPSSYVHDLKFVVKVSNQNHPVTKGVKDFEINDETYKGYYVEEGVTPLLTTSEPSSTPVIGWTKKYGKARIVTLQSGHDVPTYENPSFRRILKQAIEWVTEPPPLPVIPDGDPF
ncbi:MAG: ThuA domain-containing protein [Bacteroidales bacterium]|nr:ThuA domain-containing protein [Bacteroidales bacterium]